ncbi:hypothetical protein AK88_05184 [Plasmodium fragile]|uniref:Schizont-infected cell agglutination C-terminal domain-containing protein n=1 Tax=Plasmodium fragile TaxID=5857 RepID=A0A0D9QDR3_PLAFR|nr:uncharacterized protein AK88_05184 [Plasmodium fragile]KJP85190.1 hypothetical protein AK88_05184 [Plasmodium fragile]
MGSVDLANALAQWVIRAGIPDQDKYEEMVWNKTKEVMAEFVDYMQNDDIISYATPCGNAGWEHQKYPAGVRGVGQTVGDKIVCVLMVGALYFMNGWNRAEQVRPKEDATNESIREHLRCIIVHMFSQVLHESVCRSRWATLYAWYSMVEFGQGDGVGGGLIKKGTCGRNISSDVQIREVKLNEKVKLWLGQNSTLKKAIHKITGNTLCKTPWQDEWNLEDILGKGQANVADAGRLRIVTMVKNLEGEMRELLTAIGKQVQQEVRDREDAKRRELGETGEVWGSSDSFERNRTDKYTHDNYRPFRTKDDQNGEAATTTTVPAATTGSTAKEKEKKKEARPPEPPPAQTPTEPPVAGGTPVGQGPGPGQQPPPPPTGNTCTESSTSTNTSASGVSVSFGCTSDKELGVPPSTILPPPDPAPGNTASKDTESKNGTEAGSAQPTSGPAPAATPTTPAQGSSGSSADPAPAPQPNGASGGERKGGADGAGEGSDDDFSWVDKNPWGNSTTGAGASASGTMRLRPSSNGKSGASAATSPTDRKQFELELASPALNIHGATGGFVPPVPAAGTVSSSGVTPGDYAVPDLTGTVLTATTPVLFFLASVTVALLGYSLWKYFAHLAKRRRTYRTVRDVPSPPLDEEILDHLQRGDLPPPDYGYTMVRARRRDKFADRRRRHPRVHKRTIIELHLELLNECEATAWENVKDDYLQIVVQEFAQEFAQDLMRDEETNNNILDVSTSHASVTTHDSTTDHSTTADSTTDDSKTRDPTETDTFSPNEDDPWSCMESIHTATEQSPATGPEDATSYCTQWITWMERNKHILRACTTQPWFLQLTADWKQYLLAHMAANDDNVVSAHREFRDAATVPMMKLRLWKEWVAQQHELMNIYGEEAWFQYLWSNIAQSGVVTEEDGMPEQIRTVEGVSHIHTVDEKPTTFVTDQGPPVEKELKVEGALEGGSALKVRHLPQQQLHPQPYMKKRLTATIWMLLLALIIEECELECRLQQTQLYVDELLHKL